MSAPEPVGPTPAARTTRILLWVAVALVCLAVVGNVVRASHQGWVLEGDDAAIAINTFDTVHGHPRLVGVHSSAASYAGIGDFYHPGPMEYWLSALPAGAFGWSPTGFLFTAALVNCAAVIGVAVFARRRGGDRFALGAMVATAAVVWGLGSEVPHDVWNPHIAVLPWLLTLVLLWSIADGDRAALVPFAVVASFTLQNHFSYLPLVGPLLLLAVGSVLLVLRERRRRDPDSWPVERRRWLAGGGVAAAVGLVLWLPTLIQQATGHPGNLGQLATFVRQGSPSGRRGPGWGLSRLQGFLGSRPLWLDRRATFFTMLRLPNALDAIVTIAVLVAAVALLVWHARRGRRTTARLLALLLAALVLQVVAAASLPKEISSALRYNYLAWFPLCGVLWLAVVWASAQLVPWTRVRSATGPLALAAVAVLSAAVVTGTSIQQDRSPDAFPAIRALNGGVRRALPGKGPWFVVADGGLAYLSLQNPVILDLVRHGYDVRIPREREPFLGHFRRVDPHHLAGIVVIASGPGASRLPRGAKQLVRVDAPGAVAPPSPAVAYPVVAYLLPPDRLADVGGPEGRIRPRSGS
ncbi:MAG: hypothetical protein JWM05_2054 [Acidimicrobiales bacterium]|nr:hypothetical protein [Acidimicrobiales bacterium]